MHSERPQVSTTNTGPITRIYTGPLTVEAAQNEGFVEYDPGLDGMQIALQGYNSDNRIVRIVPIVLYNEEIDEARASLDGFKKICQKAEDLYANNLR